MRRSLRWKILLYTSALIGLLLVLTLGVVNWQAQRVTNQQITANLGQARQRIEVKQSERIARLTITSQLVASFPALNAALATRDAATVRDFLTSYQQDNRLSDLLVLLGPDGRVAARTDAAEPGAVENAATRWVQPALQNPSRAATGLLETPSTVYDAVCVPAQAGGTVFGFVIAGARIDSAYALDLRGAGSEEVVLAGGRLLGTTIPEASLPWQSRDDWGGVIREAGRMQTILLSGESYAAQTFFLGSDNPRLLAVVLQSRDVALAPYRRIQLQLLGVGAVMILLGVTASTFLSRSVSTGVSRLEAATERVARGDFRTTIEVEKSDAIEISNLARSFNEMTRGLRERADMQKFISQSTVDMIRARGGEKMAAGGRVEMTLFFSDIRGFTVMSEKLAPEDVVRILNECLSLQAGIVQKYEGDIDKFMGDCVMAHFYEPNSTVQAVQCAIEIEKAMQKMNERLAASERIEVGIGIARGEAILGSIGSETRRDFTAVGSIVNLCSRLCSIAGPSEILLSELAYKAVEQSVPAERLDPLTVKGFSKPIPVYRIAVKARATA